MIVVATVKPGLRVYEKVHTMVSLGITAFRFNFARSHVDKNLDLIHYCRTHSAKHGKACKVFVDLPGPKIRLGNFIKGSEQLVAGQAYSLDLQQKLRGDQRRAYITQSSLHRQAKGGDRLVLSSGVVLEVHQTVENLLQCQVVHGGKIYNGCGISIEGRYFENPRLSNMDMEILSKLGGFSDFICPSFVDTPPLVSQVHDVVGGKPRPAVIAKIESPSGVKNMVDIASSAEGIMLCRGDLGTFYRPEEVEELAVYMSELAHKTGKILVFATDYFRSMVDGSVLSESDCLSLKRAKRLCPDYLIINETSYSKAWFDIVQTAISFDGP